MTGILKTFGISLGLTLAIEMALAFLLRIRTKKGLLIVLLANVLTNPAAVFLCMASGLVPGKGYYLFQLGVEALVVLTEGFVYGRFRDVLKAAVKPMLLSLILNACSYGTGLVLNLLL
ncbi:MAG: hypothetical protein IJM50_02470 [Lachnospiraceae bacterium]|nr:hypothetical protein [Lachnospiraceae bacterium]